MGGLDRRKFLTGASLGAAGLAAGCDCAETCGVSAGPAAEGKTRKLKMVTTWPKNFPGVGDAADEVARRISVMSGGAITVDVFAAGELVGAFEAFDAVAGGAADFYHGAEYYWVGKSKAYPFFTAVPFGMTAAEIMAWVNHGGGQALWDELSAPFNVKAFQAGNTGHQMGGWFKREIRSLEDLKGLKVRMPGLGGDVLRRLGAAAIAIPGGEIYQALQSGAIDGTEWIGPWNDLAFGFYQEAPYYYGPGFHEPGAALGVGVNLDLWRDMDAREKLIVQTACEAANNDSLSRYNYFNAVALESLRRDKGVTPRPFPDDVMAAFARESKAVLEATAKSDPMAKRVYDSYRDAMAKLSAWGDISESPYMNIRREVYEI